MICPVCRNSKTEFFFEAKNTHGSIEISEEKFVILKCFSCGLVFPEIEIGKDFYKKYYPKDYYVKSRFLFKIVQKVYQAVCFSWLKFLITRFAREGKILDFGCGQGVFLANLPETFKKYGVEVNSEAVKHIKKNLPEIKIFENLSFFKRKFMKFKLITLFHVLEHLEEPKKILSQLVNLLEEDGFLILSTPNSRSFGLKVSGSFWFHLDTPRHLAIFNLDNLTKLVKDLGLEIVNIKGNWLEYPLDLFWSIFNRLKTKKPFLNFLLGLFILPVSLIIKGFILLVPRNSEVITLVCQKK